MDSEALRVHGREMLDFVAEHWARMRERRKPMPDVQPGYLDELLPLDPPNYPEEWTTIFQDLEKVVMQGTANWNHPHFFSYYPAACSYPAIMGDMLAGGISGLGMTWKANPAMTELEKATLDWLVRCLGLPEHFLNSDAGPGCGIIQSTASDATIVALMAARARAVEAIQAEPNPFQSWVQNPDVAKTMNRILERVRQNKEEQSLETDIIQPHFHDPAVYDRFVAYCADQAHCSVEKCVLLCGVKLRKLKTTRESTLGNYTVTAETLENAIKEDRARGLIPFVFVATMGYTTTCGVDFLKDLGPICNREHLWLHVDAAYAGAFLLCPELRYLSEGIETVDSFNFNAHKTMMVNFDCSPMWFKDGQLAAKYFTVHSLYLKNENGGTDYRHLQVVFGRRFRALKLWFVLRSLGVAVIQEQMRTLNDRAGLFAKLVEADGDIELFLPRHLGLACFRIPGPTNAATETLLNALNADGRIHLMAGAAHGIVFLRFSVSSVNTTEEDVQFAFKVIKELALPIIQASKSNNH